MKRFLNFLLSGPGLIGKQHAGLIASRPDSALRVIVAPPSDENCTFAREMGAKLYHSVDEALQHEAIDAAIISSPNPFHFEQALSCITSGIPTLVEKPVTDVISDAQKLANLADELQIPVLVGHHRTYSPLLEAAEAFMNSPHFGDLVAVQGAALFYKPQHYFQDGPWRTRKGGGPILINLIHEIGLLRHFCGEIKNVVAVASSGVRKFEVEDTVSITFTFFNGCIGNFLLSDVAASSKSWEMTSGENPSYPHDATMNCYHFAGTNGSLDFPTMRARYYPQNCEKSWLNPFEFENMAFVRKNPLELQLEHFIQVIRKDAQPKVSARDGYKNVLVVDAIMRSIASRAIVDIADVE